MDARTREKLIRFRSHLERDAAYYQTKIKTQDTPEKKYGELRAEYRLRHAEVMGVLALFGEIIGRELQND